MVVTVDLSTPDRGNASSSSSPRGRTTTHKTLFGSLYITNGLHWRHLWFVHRSIYTLQDGRHLSSQSVSPTTSVVISNLHKLQRSDTQSFVPLHIFHLGSLLHSFMSRVVKSRSLCAPDKAFYTCHEPILILYCRQKGPSRAGTLQRSTLLIALKPDAVSAPSPRVT